MKKFKFSLENILKYREKVEENEKNTLALMNVRLNEILSEIESLRSDYRKEIENFEKISEKGMTVREAVNIQVYIKNIERTISLKLEEANAQRKKIERQTQVVVKATQDVKILIKLKEKKLKEYTKMANKKEEMRLDEFVSYTKFEERQSMQ